MGTIVSLIAAVIIYDAITTRETRPYRERRRRQRADLDLAGEWMVGIGTACLGAALFGGEGWRWQTVIVLMGVALIVGGAVLNRQFLREMLLFRGAARRTTEMEIPPDLLRKDAPLRIR